LKLKDRIEGYIKASSQMLVSKLPVIFVVNGIGFKHSTALLDKPFSAPLAKALCATLFNLTEELEGAVFGYSFNDELIVITRNDQNIDTQPWYGNDAQTLASVASSIATLHFQTHLLTNGIDLKRPIFRAKAFVVPNITEAVNTLIFKQQQAAFFSLYSACFYELLAKGLDKNDIRETLANTTTSEDKVELLARECGIDYNTAYPLGFRRGVACYRRPKLIDDIETKMVWEFDSQLPIFTRDTEFLKDVLNDR
jgi:tRNA(His) 5'-end guanylyltransferase